jgi:hypothetical protein
MLLYRLGPACLALLVTVMVLWLVGNLAGPSR